MSLVNYTDYDSIRAALGVSSDEIGDDILSLPLYEDYLASDLEDVHIDLDSKHTLTAAIAVPSDEEKRFLRYSRLFATYSVARALTSTLPMFSPKSIEDGKAKMDRYNDPYKATITAVLGEFERWKSSLLTAYLALGASATASVTRSYMSTATPGSDPITGA